MVRTTINEQHRPTALEQERLADSGRSRRGHRDVRDVRESLTVLINGTPGFECSGSYRTMEDALTGVERSRPDVILTDIGLAGMNGIEGTRILRERYPHVPVVALNVYLREHLI